MKVLIPVALAALFGFVVSLTGDQPPRPTASSRTVEIRAAGVTFEHLSGEIKRAEIATGKADSAFGAKLKAVKMARARPRITLPLPLDAWDEEKLKAAQRQQ